MLTLRDLESSVFTINEKAMTWVVKNQKLLTEKFTKKFSKSPFEFTVQIKAEKGSVLVDNTGSVTKKANRKAYLTWIALKRLGCPSSI